MSSAKKLKFESVEVDEAVALLHEHDIEKLKKEIKVAMKLATKKHDYSRLEGVVEHAKLLKYQGKDLNKVLSMQVKRELDDAIKSGDDQQLEVIFFIDI